MVLGMRIAAIVSSLSIAAVMAACSSSTAPQHKWTLDGQWSATDSLQRTMVLNLTQQGDSVHGAGTVGGTPVHVFGLNLWPDTCTGGQCLRAIELTFALIDAASDTILMAGQFGADSNHVAVIGMGQAPGRTPFPFAMDTTTLVRVSH